MDSSENQRERRSLVIFMFILFAAFFALLRPFLISLTLAAILATLFYPMYIKLKTLFRERSRLASLATTLFIFVLFVLPLSALVSILVEETSVLVNSLDLRHTFANVLSNGFYQAHVAPYVAMFEKRFHIEIDIIDVLSKIGQQLAKYVYGFSPQVVTTTATFVFHFFVSIVSVYFLFLEGPYLMRLFLDLSPLRHTHDGKLLQEVRSVLYASVYGYLVTALVQGVLSSLGFLVFGISGAIAMVFGLATFFFSMVPVVGAAGVWIPVVIWVFASGSTGAGVGLLVYSIVVISGIDNILKPLIIRGRTKIHPLLIFFSIFGGIVWVGPIGILLGPVIASLLVATISIYREEFL